MKISLNIKNFGPIKSVELELGRFNVLIGDQGTGKSTIAKLLIAIRNTYAREIFDLVKNEFQSKQTQLFLGHLKLVGIQNYLSVDSIIYVKTSDFTFDYQNQNLKLETHNDTTNKLFYDFTYIPSERNLAITISDSLFSLMQAGTALSQLFLRFGNKFEQARKDKESFDYTKIIGINYIHRESGDIVKLPSGQEILIDDSSSGIQGSIALLTVFDYVIKTRTKKNLLVIEEPELNCFPITQSKLIYHFVENNFKSNYNEDEDQVLITTHSPYILTSLNNLMYAYKIGQIHRAKVNTIIEEKYWLNPNDVNAYLLKSDLDVNGITQENIIDKEGLIKTEKIDSVSAILNADFNAIMDIELNIQK